MREVSLRHAETIRLAFSEAEAEHYGYAEEFFSLNLLDHERRRNLDIRVDGQISDVYSPKSDNVKSVHDTLISKANPLNPQASNIVVNLADSSLNISQVAEYVARNPVRGLKSLMVIKDGKVVVLRIGG